MRETTLSADVSSERKDNDLVRELSKPLHLSPEVFETVSKKTWVDVLMQTIKVSLSSNKYNETIYCFDFISVWYWVV